MDIPGLTKAPASARAASDAHPSGRAPSDRTQSFADLIRESHPARSESQGGVQSDSPGLARETASKGTHLGVEPNPESGGDSGDDVASVPPRNGTRGEPETHGSDLVAIPGQPAHVPADPALTLPPPPNPQPFPGIGFAASVAVAGRPATAAPSSPGRPAALPGAGQALGAEARDADRPAWINPTAPFATRSAVTPIEDSPVEARPSGESIPTPARGPEAGDADIPAAPTPLRPEAGASLNAMRGRTAVLAAAPDPTATPAPAAIVRDSGTSTPDSPAMAGPASVSGLAGLSLAGKPGPEAMPSVAMATRFSAWPQKDTGSAGPAHQRSAGGLAIHSRSSAPADQVHFASQEEAAYSPELPARQPREAGELESLALKPRPAAAFARAEAAGQSGPGFSLAAPASGPSLTAQPLFPVSGPVPVAVAHIAAPQIAAALPSAPGSGRIELRLDPPELGRVEITFDIADQTLRTTVVTERPAVGEMLRRHADILLTQLQQAGFTEVDLRFGRENPDPRWGSPSRPLPFGQPSGVQPDSSAPAAPASYSPRFEQDGLDLRF